MDWIVIAGLTGGAVMVVDERDDVQKKTFTKWINKHLVKVASHDTCTLPWLLLLLACLSL